MIPAESKIEWYMCEMLQERGLPLPKGYTFDGRRNLVRKTDEVNENIEYDMQCLRLAALDSIASDMRRIRRWVVFWGVLGVIALVISILF